MKFLKILCLALAFSTASAQIPEGAAVILERVPYEQPMWSRADPFGFASLAALTNGVPLLGPRITAVEAYTNLAASSYSLGLTNAQFIAGFAASSPFWDAAYQAGVTNADAIAALRGASAQWDAAFALAQTNSARLGVIDGLSPYWTSAYAVANTNNLRLNAYDNLAPLWSSAYYLGLTNAAAITALQASVSLLPTTAYVDSKDALDRAYAYALFQSATATTNATAVRVLDKADLLNSWLEYESNTVWRVTRTYTPATTNYQWYAYPALDLAVSFPEGSYNFSKFPTNGTYAAAFVTNAVAGATASTFAAAAGFQAFAVLGDTEVGFASDGSSFSPCFRVGGTFYSSSGYFSDNTPYSGSYYLFGSPEALASFVYVAQRTAVSTNRSFSLLSFDGACSEYSGGLGTVYTVGEADQLLTVFRADTVVAATTVTNRVDLLADTNLLWQAIGDKVPWADFNSATQALFLAVSNAGKVSSVNSQTGAVVLAAADVGAVPTAGGEMDENATLAFRDLYLTATFGVSALVLSAPPFGIDVTLNYPQDIPGSFTLATREWAYPRSNPSNLVSAADATNIAEEVLAPWTNRIDTAVQPEELPAYDNTRLVSVDANHFVRITATNLVLYQIGPGYVFTYGEDLYDGNLVPPPFPSGYSVSDPQDGSTVTNTVGGWTISAAPEGLTGTSVASDYTPSAWYETLSPSSYPFSLPPQDGAYGSFLVSYVEVATNEVATFAKRSDLDSYVKTNHIGDVTVDGTVTATSFQGDGSLLTGLSSGGISAVTATNIVRASIIFTNGTTLADGVYSGTNGVFFTKNSTNYWVLLP